MTTDFSFIQLADPQFGMFASSSGKTDEEIAALAERGLMIHKVPKFEGFAHETELFTRAIERANWLKPAFVVVCGDMVNESDNDIQVAEVKRIAALLDGSIPLHWVAGNHDIAVDHLNPDQESRDRYIDNFGPDYYAFSHGGVRFIVINSTLFTSPGPLADQAKAQLAFVEAEAIIVSIQHARSKDPGQGAAQIVLFSHHPLFIESPDEPDNEWSITQPYRTPLLELAADHGIKTNFAGHWHRNNIAEKNGLEVISSGPVGLPLWHDPSGFRVVNVTAGGITHEYHSLETE
ncbi:MAG: metallophosphoesterase [Chloroflexi bacterium]|nr:metallophosphoesterase [Chloroflexota bacterium]